MINNIHEIKDKDIFLYVQDKWNGKYPNLTLIVLDDRDNKAYRFTWEVNTPHVQDALGSWQSIEKKKFNSPYVPDNFVYMIDKLEAEFIKCAIEHYLRW